MQDKLKEKTELLYSSLNVHHAFLELRGVDYEFVCLLIMAQDLKINIRKCTKLHQATQKAIAKCKPALVNVIRKFNGYCAQLAALYREEWHMPLPEPLPVKLALLRDSTLLLEDVWISETLEEEVPRWLKDINVQNGIRAMLKADCCLEERRRLGVESDNLCCWFGHEVLALRLALNNHSNSPFFSVLQQQYDHLVSLKDRWSNQLASCMHFESHIASAENLANPSTTAVQPALTWLLPQRNLVETPWPKHALASFNFDDTQPLATSGDGEDTDNGSDEDDNEDQELPSDGVADDGSPVELGNLYEDIQPTNDLYEDSTPTLLSHSLVKVVWALPDPYSRYIGLLSDLSAQVPPTSIQTEREASRYFYH
ncbi:hypothetical protein H0H92_006160 [Tricholoma furcatifolium]|nr:hypothetical protein H0H92_006160 [Tricholoma furcatifolium]